MATAVKKGGKINFAKVVAPAKEDKGDQAAVVKAVNFNVKATNDLGKTMNSIAEIMMETKNIQVEAFKKMSDGAKVDFKPTFNQSPGAAPIPDEGGGEEEEKESPGGGWLMNLLGVFKDIIMIAIAGPVMKWLSDPKNQDAVKNIVEGLIKFFGFVAKFLTDRVIGGLEGLRKMIEGNWWEKIVGLFQLVTNFAGLFLAIRWLKNPMKLVKDLKKLFKVFAKGLKMTSKKMIKRLGVIGLLIGAGMALKEGLKKDEEEDGGEGGDTINGNPVSKDDSIELSNLRDRLESLENEGKTHGDPEFDKDYARQEELENKYANKPEMAKGGWISGPQSGYPVSLDGGRSTSFIGHGTEYVAQRSRGGFVIPFDTPATRKDSGLTGRRMGEARSRGYKLPGRSEGGPINVNNFFPEYNTGGKLKNQNTGRIKDFDKSHYGKEGYQIGQINPEQLVYGQSKFIEKTVTVNGEIDEEQSFSKFEELMGSIGVPDLIDHQKQLMEALKSATGKRFNVMDVYNRATGLDPDTLFPILKKSDAQKATDDKKAAAHQRDLKIRGIKPGEGYSIFEGEMFDKGGIIQPTIQPVINLMSHGGAFNPVLPMPQPMFLGGQIKKAARGVKKLATGAWNKVSSTAQGVMAKATDAVRGIKGDSKKEKQKAAMEAIQKAQEMAAIEEAKIAAMSASSMKQVAAAKGAAAGKKPTVVGGGGRPTESLVDRLQSYNSIWK